MELNIGLDEIDSLPKRIAKRVHAVVRIGIGVELEFEESGYSFIQDDTQWAEIVLGQGDVNKNTVFLKKIPSATRLALLWRLESLLNIGLEIVIIPRKMQEKIRKDREER